MPPVPAASAHPQERSPRSEYEAGTVIAGRYRLEAPIGFGGMGTVWRAHNELLDSPLALKVLRSSAHCAGSSERLLLEAKAAASLCHPAIVRVFDFGVTEHGDSFLAMELLQGESFGDLLEREHTLPAEDAVRLLLPILAGLTCAHARGIVHRDLKPHNIFLARDDSGCVEPKVVDFGIAKFEGSASHLTSVGVLLGSPSYMSPEQSLGQEEIDMRADVWAVAVVLYEAIAGKPPWSAPNCPALLRAIVCDAPVPIVGIGGVDAELWAVIERGLAKQREDRWPSSHDLGRALALWLDKRGVADDISGTSLKTAWLAAPDPGKVRGSLPSIPQSASSETLEAQEDGAGCTQESDSRRIARPVWGTRRRKLALAVGIPLAASLMLFQLGFRAYHSSATSVLAVATTGPDARHPGGGMESSTERLALPATDSVAPARAPTAALPPRATPAPSASLSALTPAARAPSQRRGSARAMDYGF